MLKYLSFSRTKRKKLTDSYQTQNTEHTQAWIYKPSATRLELHQKNSRISISLPTMVINTILIVLVSKFCTWLTTPSGFAQSPIGDFETLDRHCPVLCPFIYAVPPQKHTISISYNWQTTHAALSTGTTVDVWPHPARDHHVNGAVGAGLRPIITHL